MGREIFVAALAVIVASIAEDSCAATLGRTLGYADTSSSGAATYEIPLSLPRGTNGLTPSLSLRYSHGDGNGLLGVGWSIGGLSVVSRCHKTIAQDINASAATLAASDGYCLDGNRLRLVSGTYGAAGSIYQTEVEIFSRVTALGGGGFGPDSWEVRGKNGLIYEYGNSPSSKIESVGSQAVRLWALNKIRDRSGNYIEFLYIEDNGGFRPDKIRYTDHPTLPTDTSEVVFEYETVDRPDPIYRYEFGSHVTLLEGQVNQFKRLVRINVNNGSTLRRYKLTYESGAGGRSRIDKIQECSGTDCFPETQLTWIDGTPSWASSDTSTGQSIPTGAAILVGDISGDGRDDLVYSTHAASGSGVWAYMLGTDSGYANGQNTILTNWHHADAQLIEWNGDGLKDVLVPCQGNTTWCVLQSTGSGFSLITTSTPSTGSNGSVLAADLNADGRDDLVRMVGGTQLAVRMRVTSGFEPAETTAWTAPPNTYFFNGNFGTMRSMKLRSLRRRVDFNGDSREDFVLRLKLDEPEPGVPDYVYVGTFFGGGYAISGGEDIGTSFLPSSAGDFNGDGLSDLLFVNTTSITTAMGQGTSFSNWITGPPTSGLQTGLVLVLDYDGDGLDDIVVPKTTPANWHVSRSQGNSFTALTDLGLATPWFANGPSRAADLNGDGLGDITRSDTNVVKLRLHNGVYPDLLDRVTDGFGVFVDFNYAPLTAGGATYTKGTGAAHPVRDYRGPMYVVSSYTASNGVGGNYSMTYSYRDARIHDAGRGFLGFGKRTATDSRTGIYTEETFDQGGTPFGTEYAWIGALKARTAKQSSGGAKIHELTNMWARKLFGSAGSTERRFPYVTQAVEKDYTVPGGAHSRTATTTVADPDMDDWGTAKVVTTVTTEVGTGDYSGSYRTQRVRHVAVMPPDANWCLSKPTQTEITSEHTLNNGGLMTRTVNRAWDSANCRIQQEVIEPGSTQWKVTTDFGYDSHGNLQSIAVTPVGQGTRVSSVNWGSKGRYAQSATNPAGHVTNLSWTTTGQLATVRGPNSPDPADPKLSFEYDGFDRPTRVIRPDGTQIETEYLSCAGDSDCTSLVSNYEYKVRTTLKGTGGGIIAQAFEVLDDFDRVRRASNYQLGGGTSDVLTAYRADGWVDKTTQPYYTSGGTPVWTTYTPDILGRVTQSSRPRTDDNDATAHSESRAFSGLIQTFTNAAGKQTSVTFSAWGDVLKVVDAYGKQVVYEYDAFGNVKKVTDAAGNISTFNYNVRGMKMSSTDPDMGTWNYDYYPLGELKLQTAANGRTVNFDPYDPLGRPTRRHELEGTTEWTWGNSTAADNIGQLAYVTSPGWREDYFFDSLARPSSTTTQIDGSSYSFTYGYHPTNGYLETLQYPASYGMALKIKYEYETANKSGLLKKVSDFRAPSTVFWEATSTDAFSQYMHVQLGGASGAQLTKTFDGVTGALNQIETHDGGIAVQNLEYQWNKLGSLKKRKDLRQGSLEESFSYDDLQRLTGATIGAATQGVTYDTTTTGLGNIMSKSDVGTYSYTAIVSGCSYYAHTQPHAVRQITGTPSQSFCYDKNGNMTKRNGATISWYSYNLPQTINQTDGMYVTFSYDAFRRRYKQVALAFPAPNTKQRTTTYVQGLFEKVRDIDGGDVTSYRHSIFADGNVIAVNNRDSTSSITHFLNDDHLGSLEHMAGLGGAAFARFSSDAWGKRRDSDWVGPPAARDLNSAWSISNRAFTEHEMLDNMGLVHMNGRVYDPSIGRFISADPYVPDAFNLQAFNRYAYVYNNPLSYIDPSGFDPVPGGDSGAVRPGTVPHNPRIDNGRRSPPVRDNVAPSPGPDPAQPSQVPQQICRTGTTPGINPHAKESCSWEGRRRPTIEEARRRTDAHIRELQASLLYSQLLFARLEAEQKEREGRNILAEGALEMLEDASTLANLIPGPGRIAGGITSRATRGALGTERGVSVLGHYPTYVNTAESIGARHFNVPGRVWAKMSPAEQWAANTRFLDRLIARGDTIILATPVSEVRAGSWLARELEYLASRGYALSVDGTRMLPPLPR